MCLCAGCADGGLSNPFSSSESTPPTTSYYYGEFADIPIPNELRESSGDTFITVTTSGVKCGVQRFTGRVDMVSLMNTMRRHMAANGWTLRSLLRAKESVLVFEKTDRMAALHFHDGMITTDMRIFVSSRLEGDAGSLEANPYIPPASSDDRKLEQ